MLDSLESEVGGKSNKLTNEESKEVKTADELFYILCRKGYVIVEDSETKRQVKAKFEEMFPEQAVTENKNQKNRLEFEAFKMDKELRISYHGRRDTEQTI